MKRLGILVLVALLIMGTVTGTSLADPVDNEVMTLSLDEAIDYALEHNPNVKLIKVSLDEAKKAYKQADDAKEKIEDNPYAPAGLDTSKVKELYPAQAKRGYEAAKVNLDYTKRAIRLAVESAYYNVLSAEKKVSVAETTYQKALEQVNLARAAFAAGTKAKNDVLQAEVALAGARVGLNQAENDLDIAYMKLNRALGLDLDQSLKLTTRLEYMPVDSIDVAEVLAEAAGKDAALVGARVTYENALDAFELTAKFYTPNGYTYKDAKYAADKAKVNYAEAQKDFELNVIEAYKNLRVAEANYKMRLKSVEQAEESLRLSRLRYEVGVATSLEVISASEILNNQELELIDALKSYNLVKAQFRHMVFGGASAAGPAGFSAGASIPPGM